MNKKKIHLEGWRLSCIVQVTTSPFFWDLNWCCIHLYNKITTKTSLKPTYNKIFSVLRRKHLHKTKTLVEIISNITRNITLDKQICTPQVLSICDVAAVRFPLFPSFQQPNVSTLDHKVRAPLQKLHSFVSLLVGQLVHHNKATLSWGVGRHIVQSPGMNITISRKLGSIYTGQRRSITKVALILA